MRAFARALSQLALFLRQLGALSLLLLSVRLLWMSGQVGLGKLGQVDMAGGPSQSELVIPKNPGSHRPDLEQLRKLVGEEAESADLPPPLEGPRLRRILVDLGPERSEVFVRGQRVGHTPYGGQISCTLDEILKVQVLPPHGVPLERTLVCRGDTLIVQQ